MKQIGNFFRTLFGAMIEARELKAKHYADYYRTHHMGQ